MSVDESRRDVELDLEPLMAASRTINAVIVRSMASVDRALSVPELRVMVILARVEQASLTEVAERLGVNASNASRACDQLVKRRLVRRKEDAQDRRRVVLTLSASGERVVQRVMDRRRELFEEIVAAMPAEHRAALIAALGPFNAAADATGASDGAVQTAGHRMTRWLG
jgi:DNA-binding MarR family transcriptional regulator